MIDLILGAVPYTLVLPTSCQQCKANSGHWVVNVRVAIEKLEFELLNIGCFTNFVLLLIIIVILLVTTMVQQRRMNGQAKSIKNAAINQIKWDYIYT